MTDAAQTKYRPYPVYKPSGVEWLGEIPAGWELKKVSWGFKATKGKNGQMLTKEYCGENPGPYPVYSGQTENEGVLGRISWYEFDFGSDGTLFATTVGAQAMNLSYLSGKLSLSQNCMLITPADSKFLTRFFFYHFQPLFRFERSLIPDHMQASFRVEDLYQYHHAVPTLSEQREIVGFLDHETAKIDGLIAKQQRLIALLEEKRQAMISHAVTKGLDPTAPMRPSGIDWLGDVPAHWTIVQSRRLFSQRTERARFGDKQLTASQKYGVLFQADFMAREGKRVVQVIKGADILKHVEPKDFIISMRSFQGGLELCHNSGSMSSAYVALTPIKHIVNDFFYFLFKSNPYIQALQATTNLVRDGQALRYDNFSLVPLPIIPEEEQKHIASFLAKQANIFLDLSQKAEAAIALLKERRAALISAAVTGKIDLRDWQQPEGAQPHSTQDIYQAEEVLT